MVPPQNTDSHHCTQPPSWGTRAWGTFFCLQLKFIRVRMIANYVQADVEIYIKDSVLILYRILRIGCHIERDIPVGLLESRVGTPEAEFGLVASNGRRKNLRPPTWLWRRSGFRKPG